MPARIIRVFLTGDQDGQIIEWEWEDGESFAESYAAAEGRWGYRIVGRVEII